MDRVYYGSLNCCGAKTKIESLDLQVDRLTLYGSLWRAYKYWESGSQEGEAVTRIVKDKGVAHMPSGLPPKIIEHNEPYLEGMAKSQRKPKQMRVQRKGNNEAEMDVDQYKEDPCSEEKLNSTIQVQTSEPTEAKNESPSQQPINGKDSPKQGNIKSSGVTVARKSNKRNSKIIPKKPVQEITNGDQVTDTRKCQLCNRLGDDEPTRAGRLLYSALDEWVHINCGLWSAEVFEDDEGRLQNVQAAVTRGKMMKSHRKTNFPSKSVSGLSGLLDAVGELFYPISCLADIFEKCELCGEAGATVGCCENRCPMNYHFMCGRDAEAVYQDDKKVYCAQHSFRAKEDLVLKDKQFHVERRVCVDMSRVRTKGAGLKGAEPHAIQLMKGCIACWKNMRKVNNQLYPFATALCSIRESQIDRNMRKQVKGPPNFTAT
ncbi:predicted protein [Nematostella vectensis]|uniref:PHD-type domain-containing protein n=1 Tax=Nematostella vectensis TaxID=45351 RepID=A7RLK2_NEMVE|nr:predicted protein [Nematostella vectensis]|eukprot:XP_001639681.1 predicted protein [Nematostella vectensis]